MTYVERFFEEKLNKRLEDLLNKKYPDYEFKFEQNDNGGNLIVNNKDGILCAVYSLADFDLKLNLNVMKDAGNWYLDYIQDVPENILNKIYFQTLKRNFKLEYYDSYINYISKANRQDVFADDFN